MSTENSEDVATETKLTKDSGLDVNKSIGAVGEGDILSTVQSLSLCNITEDCNEETIKEFLRLKAEGNDLYALNNYKSAIEKYVEAEKYATIDEQLAALLHNKGATFEKLGEPEKAIEAYNEAVEKKPRYYKVLNRRCKLLSTMERYSEALDDLLEVSIHEFKIQQSKKSTKEYPPSASVLTNVLSAYADQEIQKAVVGCSLTFPPKYIVDSFLRPFYADPVSRLWKGLDPSPVDPVIKEGKADHLKGYMAAIRDLKLKKYKNISQLCTDEILNPESEETLMNAYFLRGSMGLIWASMNDEAYADIKKAIESPCASNQMKSSAYLKLALRHPIRHEAEIKNLAEGFSQAEEMWTANPDVYFHGSITLIERGHPQKALEMLELGLQLCGSSSSVLMQALYWSIKFSLSSDDWERSEASSHLIKLEPAFDSPECHEMYAQALVICGEQFASVAVEQMDKAIAYNPEDPAFRIKKLIISRWSEEKITECLEDLYKFVETEPNGIAYHHIGQFEIMSGDFEKGLAAWDKSIALSNSIHEIGARVAAKIEMQFHYRLNQRLVEEGMEPLSPDLCSLALKPFA